MSAVRFSPVSQSKGGGRCIPERPGLAYDPVKRFDSHPPAYGCFMILSVSHRTRNLLTGLSLAVAIALGSAQCAQAQDDKAKTTHSKSDKATTHDGKAKDAKSDKKPGEQGKSVQIGTFGEWGAYQSQGKSKTCYALAQPKSRDPSSTKREAAYIFISSRPAENVKNEISVIMGFPMKDGGEAQVEIGDSEFGLIAKGSNAWVKNPAEESHMIDAMKKGSKLIVKAASNKGKVTTDTYALGGLVQALEKVRKECP